MRHIGREERERETKRMRESDRDREKARETKRETKRERERDKEKERGRERERDKERARERERERERERTKQRQPRWPASRKRAPSNIVPTRTLSIGGFVRPKGNMWKGRGRITVTRKWGVSQRWQGL